MHDLNDTFLVQKISEGCQKAFSVVCDRYYIRMFFITKKYLKDANLAEDAVQDMFVKVWEKRLKLNHVNSIKSYLFTTVRNHVQNMLRDIKSELIFLSGVREEKLPFKNPTEEKLQHSEYEIVIRKGVREIVGRKREVFELRTIKGLTNSEIAKLLQIHACT